MAKKKYNDNSKSVSDWSSNRLKSEARALYFVVNDDYLGCFNSRDLLLLDQVMNELGRRGYDVKENLTISKNKKGANR